MAGSHIGMHQEQVVIRLHVAEFIPPAAAKASGDCMALFVLILGYAALDYPRSRPGERAVRAGRRHEKYGERSSGG